ncbi:MAG TPA: 1-deoxy-D-xylulose-5-phosphate synthase N-terminal domain-containing protein [Alphaproteobacteria bacterium]|nr:1-deoxy-D-xylulose-5-phosphate synthase N-terminal domain-containing protein [Alphaproteobacteria bacterium]
MTAQLVPLRRAPTPNLIAPATLDLLTEIERKVLWLACWTIHNANHLRPSRDGLKVGGHQSSSASVATLMTALYMQALKPDDRVAVKPHASPIFHAIQYLLGKQSRDQLERFRALGGAQSYPSRTKDQDDVDFSTGSVGLGVGVTLFASLVQDYVRLHKLGDARPEGRMVAVLGDAELDEGNVYEALLEGWKHDVRNLWWIIDYNRQSLDGVVHDYLFQRIGEFFQSVGWRVVNIKYGKLLEAAFEGPAGGALRRWIDDCPNDLYSALTFKGGAAWREHLKRDLAGTSGFKELLDSHDDAALQRLMTNLGGHDMASVLEAYLGVEDDTPHCFVAYTIKGYGLPLAGHKDNHAGLMTVEQMARFKSAHAIPDGAEWEPFAGLDADVDALRRFLDEVPFKKRADAADKSGAIVAGVLPTPPGATLSTQEAFGKLLNDIGRRDDALAARIVTTSPDVTVSTNLGGWVNQRGVFERSLHPDVFRAEKVASPLKWEKSPQGQHIELGIAENNLFLMLAALGLSDRLFGARLLPIGTLYDPFIARGLDALNYACYQDARFMVVATPSGITLAPEGGAHQSITTPLIGLSQPGLTAFEPAFADELAVILEWAFAHLQAEDGGSVYLRLSTRSLEQIQRPRTPELAAGIVDGAYWLRAPAPGADLAIVYTGAVAPEAIEAHRQVAEEVPGAGLLAVTSAGRLHAGWQEARRARAAGRSDAAAPIETLLGALAPDAGLVTVTDGHPGALSWLGAVAQHPTAPLGVEHFGQSGDIEDLYRLHGLDSESILDAVAELYVRRARRRVRGPAAA